MIKVFGHKSPDTDATCSAIAYAWYSTQRGQEAEGFILGEVNKETEYVLKTAGVDKPKILSELSEGDNVVIVDTNNPEELPEDLDRAKILKIVDHHKLAGLKTDEPLDVFMKPVGCTSTLIHQRIGWEGLTSTREIAILLLSAILSDTLNFTSPTTTDQDKKAAEELSKIAGLDIEKHCDEMFAAKSDLTGLSAEDIVMMDSKVFDFKGKKVRISVLETTKPENAKTMKSKINAEVEKAKLEENLHAAFFFVIDIINNGAELFAGNDIEKEIARKAFEKDFEGEYMNLPGVVSRKKQIAPAIEAAV
jgi:manganese-dependent inorganic pyrophosphatase